MPMLRGFIHSDPDPAVVFLKKASLTVYVLGVAFTVAALYWF